VEAGSASPRVGPRSLSTPRLSISPSPTKGMGLRRGSPTRGPAGQRRAVTSFSASATVALTLECRWAASGLPCGLMHPWVKLTSGLADRRVWRPHSGAFCCE
jgi:hypothetical protein